jgi:hypothetical protein
MKRQVAIKVLPRQFTFDPQFRGRFQREAEIIAGLEHPYIVPVYDFGEHEDQPFIVMRYMPGGTLSERLEGGALPAPEIAGLFERLCTALDFAHTQGIIHRDIKPDNVLFDADGGAFLSDFGIARLIEASAALTGTGVIGTPAYMSPEQARGASALDGRSDIYSLGVVLFQAFTGRLPFKADTPMGLAVAHINDPVPDLTASRPDLPPANNAIIHRAMAKDPASRFATARELAQAIRQAQTPAAGWAAVDAATVVEPLPEAVKATVLEHSVSSRSPAAAASIPVGTAGLMEARPAQHSRSPASTRTLLAGIVLAALLCITAGIGLASGWIPNPFAAAGLAATLTATPETAAVQPTQAPTLPPATEEPTPPAAFVPVGLSTTYIEYILDASGSMLEPLEGRTRLAIAQDVLTTRLRSLPPSTQVGLRVYGHRVPYQQEQESCQDIELVVPIQPGAAAAIIDWLPSMQALGMTPMSESIRQAAEDFTFDPGRKNFIVLISDGEETCGDEPASVVEYLREIGIDFTIHVIGLDVNSQTAAQLQRIADAAGGVYHDAHSESDLNAALENVSGIMLPAPGAVAQAETPTATITPIPEPNASIAAEGSVQASSIFDSTFPTGLGVDGDLSTSWFSAGPESDGLSFYQWTGTRDDFIASIELISNREHQVVEFRQGYGFGAVTIQVLDAAGTVVFEETRELPGTPDPDVSVQPNVVGRSIRLVFSGSEALDCGGFSELVVRAVR